MERDFSLVSLLVTNPVKRPDHGHERKVRVEGFHLDGVGNCVINTENVTVDTIWDYLDLRQSVKPTFSLVQETRSFDTVMSAGRRVSCVQFDRLYPNL